MEHTQLTLDKIWNVVLPCPKDCQYVGLFNTDGPEEGWVIWYCDKNSFATQEDTQRCIFSHCIHHSPVLQMNSVQVTITLCKSSATKVKRVLPTFNDVCVQFLLPTPRHAKTRHETEQTNGQRMPCESQTKTLTRGRWHSWPL